jgi:hypothetical protein
MENTKAQDQLEFSTKERSKAEFWAWLTDGFVLSKETEKTKDNPKPERKLTVMSRVRMKDAIRDALRRRSPERAQELLEIASKPTEDLREDMVRKSIRVSPGEYTKLLYLKILERSSFADVMMKALFEPCRKKAEEITHLPTVKTPIANERLQHLLEVINDWANEKPETRASIVQTGHWSKRPGVSAATEPFHRKAANLNDVPSFDLSDAKSIAMIEPFYAKTLVEKENLADTKDAFSRLALADIFAKVSAGDQSKSVIDLFNEFKEEWKEKVQGEFFDHLSFHVFIDHSDKKPEFFFELFFECTTTFDAKRELELFLKYGEENVIDFVNKIKGYCFPTEADGKYKGITKSKEYENAHSSPYENDDEDFRVSIGTDFDFTCCKISATTPEDFLTDSNQIEQPYLENLRRQFEPLMQKIAEKVANTNFLKKYEDRKNRKEAYSFTAANDLLREALDKAETPEDYKDINSLLSIIHMQQDYDTIVDFGKYVARSTLKHNSVVSLYINSDLWRLVPLVLQEKNWISLVDDYLKERNSSVHASS